MRGPKAIVLILLAFLSVGRVSAQSYIGTVYSPSRSGISYGKDVSGDAFIDVAAGIDYGASVLKQDRQPGVSATFSYNFIVLDKEHPGGRSVIYVGPGVSVGYLRDRKKPYGLMTGISGVLGYEYRFNAFSIGASITPTFGAHMSASADGTLMDIYRNGLLWSFGPQVSVKYNLSPHKRSSKSGPEEGSGSANNGGAAGRAWPLFTFGAEWGYSANINHAYHHNYTSENGRMNAKSNYMCFRSNGYVLLHGGVNCGRHLNFSVYAGYEGIYKGQAVVPLSLRGTVLFGKDPLSSRWLAFLDGGWAFSTTGNNDGPVSRIGGGYRISLSRSVKLDLMLSYQFVYSDIELYDDSGNLIDDSRIRRNDNYFSSLNLSLGLTF